MDVSVVVKPSCNTQLQLKKRAVVLASLLVVCLILTAQDNYRVMDWKTETSLRDYQLLEMHRQYEARRAVLAEALRSETGIREYLSDCDRKFRLMVGELPEATPLKQIVTGTHNFNGYRVENIIFESRPGHHVTCNLYVPQGKGPFPAVLLLCGHEMTSKATESYQRTAVLFTRNGFAVLVVDPISQGERVQFTDIDGNRLLRGSTTEHTLLNAGASLTGSSVAAWELFDNRRALDLLVSRKEIDNERIGCLGNSGGGNQAVYLIACDERIKVAAPCSFVTSRERTFDLTGANDGCQHLPFEGRERMEIADFLFLFAPKPLLILAGKYDFVDYYGTRLTYEELAQVYELLSSREKIKLFAFDDGHGISLPKREAAVAWFARWLKNEGSVIQEQPEPVPGELLTRCTETGQVNTQYPDEKRVQDIALEVADGMSAQREAFLNENNSENVRRKICDILSISDEGIDISVEVKSTSTTPECIMNRVIIRREGELPLPCLVFSKSDHNSVDTVVVILSDRGKAEAAADTEMIRSVTGKGQMVIIADLRGIGETSEKEEANEWKYYNREYHNAMLGIHTGRPLPGQRTDDIRTIAMMVTEDKRCTDAVIKLKADGACAFPAIYSSCLIPSVKVIEVVSPVRSYYDILEKPLERDWFSYVVPGVLRYFDIPGLLSLRTDLIVRFKMDN